MVMLDGKAAARRWNTLSDRAETKQCCCRRFVGIDAPRHIDAPWTPRWRSAGTAGRACKGRLVFEKHKTDQHVAKITPLNEPALLVNLLREEGNPYVIVGEVPNKHLINL